MKRQIHGTNLARARRRQLGKHLSSFQRTLHVQRGKIAFARERRFEKLVILPARHLDRTEGPEMIGHELGVQKPKAPGLESRNQMDKGNLRGVARPMKHALAKECPAQRHSVKPADERIALVNLNAMAMPTLIELAIKQPDSRVDPGARATLRRLRAPIEDGVEVAVDGDRETVRAHSAGKPGRHMKAITRDHAAPLWFDPEQGRIVRAFSHRKYAAGIRFEQNLRRDLDQCRFTVCHSRSEPRSRDEAAEKLLHADTGKSRQADQTSHASARSNHRLRFSAMPPLARNASSQWM